MVCLRVVLVYTVFVLWTAQGQNFQPEQSQYPSGRQQVPGWSGQQQNPRYDPNYFQQQFIQGQFRNDWNAYYQNPANTRQNPGGPVTFRPATMPQSFGYVKQRIDHLPTMVTVQTALGSVTGKYVYLFDGPNIPYFNRPGTPLNPTANVHLNVSAFMGIPYAQPPVRERRFRPPEPWGQVYSYSATDYKPACPQPLSYQEQGKGIGSTNEDCLYLNIFTPSVERGSFLLPVMVYIHGGEFTHGSGNLFPGHMLAASQSVVVVTFNYRLGALGFFSTGDEVSPGNYGMLDQAMVIRWVYDHIQSFRGDRQRITLFGPGAGGASAGLHLVSPRTRDYVARVIAQSGSAVADWAAITNLERARNTSRVFAVRMGCSSESSRRLLECLRQRSSRDLSNTDIKPEVGFYAWAPVVDRDIPLDREDYRFLPSDPRTLFSSRHLNPNKQYLSGVTRDEAAYLLSKDFSLVSTNFQVTQEYFDRKIKEYVLQYNYTLNFDGVYRAMEYMYTHWADPYSPHGIREEYINMMSDALFKAPNDEIVKLLVKSNLPTYMYVLNTTVQGLFRETWEAVDHDTEYYFLTGAPFMEPEFFPPAKLSKFRGWTEEDRQMSAFFMITFANFAKEGNPTPTQIFGIDWKKMEKTTEVFLNYLNVNNTYNSSMMRNYRQLECAFWTRYMPTIIGPPPTTTVSPEEQFVELQIGFYSSLSVAVLFLILLLITCCLYCRAAESPKEYYKDIPMNMMPPSGLPKNRPPYSDYEDSMIPDDSYSNNHTEMGYVSQKNEPKNDGQQHTTV